MKQETLEEAAEKYRDYWLETRGLTLTDTFIAGAKWQAERMGLMEIELRHTKTLLTSCEKALEDRDKQAERMYSEEETLNLWNWLNDGFIIRKSLPTKEELFGWFEQFKNK